MRPRPTFMPGLRRQVGGVATAALVAAALVMVDLPAGASSDDSLDPSATADLWSSVRGTPEPEVEGAEPVLEPERFRALRLDSDALVEALATAPVEEGAPAATALGGLSARRAAPTTEPLELSLPRPDGGFERFAVEAVPIMEPGLAAQHPDIATFAGRGIDDPTTTVRADVTGLGFHASVRGSDGAWYVDPYYHLDDSLYSSYYAADVPENPHGVFVEHGDEGLASVETHVGDLLDSAFEADETSAQAVDGPVVQLREYRLALLSDPTYASFFGAENVIDAKVTLMNRVNQIYEDESAIRMLLIEGTERINLDTAAQMTGADGPCGSAPCFTPQQASGCSGGTLQRNRIVIGQLVGASAYDVGHIIFGLAGGGVASLGAVGGNAKAQGCTGLPQPVGDFFAVDYVAHEIGHQFAANHTFNGNQANCSGGNRSAANSVEPGSGSSIMAYAGICRQDDLQPHTDPYWSQRSYSEISTFVNADRPAINEVQTVSLRNFDTDGDAFLLRWDRTLTRPVVRGPGYTPAAIKAAIEGLRDFPVGGTVTVAPWGGGAATAPLNDFGFQVTFGGTLAQTDVPIELEVVGRSEVEAFTGETAKGGPVDNQGFTITDTANRAPVVDAGGDHTIPYRTPFALTGSATDADGDELTYLWEQNDRGLTAVALVNQAKTSGPLFRQFGTALDMTRYTPSAYFNPGTNSVTNNPERVFPDLAQVLAGNTNAATGTCPQAVPPVATTPLTQELKDCLSEFLPTSVYAGPMNFRLTARDGNPGAGGVGSADTQVSLAPGSGPFLVTSQAEGTTLAAGSTQTVTWDVAGTDQAPISTSQVRISLTTDGGATWDVLTETDNDGSADVQLPDVSVASARIKVEAVGNVYFAVNAADFAVRAAPVVTTDAAGDVTVQYSDALAPTVTVSASDSDSDGSDLTAVAEGLPAGLSLADGTTSADDARPGTRTWTVAGTVDAEPGTYPVTVTVTDEAGITGTVALTLVVTAEDAALTPVGDTLVTAGTGAGTGTAQVSLRATVRDGGLVAGSTDTSPGDITRATVTYSTASGPLCGPVAVGEVVAGTATTGSATCDVDLAPGTYTVLAQAGGSWTGTTSWQLQVLPARTGLLSGTGSATTTTSAGTVAADPGTAVSTTVNVRSTAGRDLTGSVTVRTTSGGTVYEARSTSLDALGTSLQTAAGTTCSSTSQTCTGTSAVRATVSVVDVATGATVATGLELRLLVSDRGTPGTGDSVSVTLWDGSTLVHSSAWDGTGTTPRPLSSGNLSVR